MTTRRSLFSLLGGLVAGLGFGASVAKSEVIVGTFSGSVFTPLPTQKWRVYRSANGAHGAYVIDAPKNTFLIKEGPPFKLPEPYDIPLLIKRLWEAHRGYLIHTSHDGLPPYNGETLWSEAATYLESMRVLIHGLARQSERDNRVTEPESLPSRDTKTS